MRLLLLALLANFSLAFNDSSTTPSASSFCSGPVKRVRRLFVLSPCVYFEVTSVDKNASTQYQYCPANESLSRTAISSIFQGFPKRVDTAVQIPLEHLSLNVTLPNSSTVWLVVTFTGGHKRILLLNRNSTLVRAPSALARQVFALLKPLVRSAISIAYCERTKQLFALLARGGPDLQQKKKLAIFDISRRHLEYAQLNVDQVHSIIEVDGRIFVGEDTRAYELTVLGSNGILGDSYTWKRFFNCYENSPLTSSQLFDYLPRPFANTNWDSHKVFTLVCGIALALVIICIVCYCLWRSLAGQPEDDDDDEEEEALESMFDDSHGLPLTIYDTDFPIRPRRRSTEPPPLFGLFSRPKKPRRRRPNRRRVTDSASSLTRPKGDYSSILDLFNPSELNLSISKIRQTSHTALRTTSIKTLPLSTASSSGESSDSPEESSPIGSIRSQPSLEYNNRRVFLAGYTTEDDGGFKMRLKETEVDEDGGGEIKSTI